ncbi:MAG: stage 0 sporulation family protein [Deltaproteobacteria bacterium]|nr:stage 0 sporulation family protein [Deltaproteobacteria bacterium]
MNLVKIRLETGQRCCQTVQMAQDVKPGDQVVVQTDEGQEMGTVLTVFTDESLQKAASRCPSVVRLATLEDLAQVQRNRDQERRAFGFCQERIQARQLPIHLVRVACLFDASKIIFYFTAPGRVDFRELVKDLVQEFRTRIELRQIGVRHRARMVGGIGICGQMLCCASFLKDFEPVSVRMAKEQQLSLNPSKISGVCGRLMCCLVYEYHSYQDLKKHLPRVGKKIRLPEGEGEGKIIRYNLIRQTVTLESAEGEELEIPLSQLSLSNHLRDLEGDEGK